MATATHDPAAILAAINGRLEARQLVAKRKIGAGHEYNRAFASSLREQADQIASTFPLGEPEFNGGMKVSLGGLLLRAAETCARSRDTKYLEPGIRALHKHIEQLRAAKTDSEAVELLAQFFSLYVGERS